MKLIISVCIVAAVSAVKQEVYKLPAESLVKLQNIATPCAQQFNVAPSYIRRLGDVTIPRNENTNKFLHCFAVNSGLVDKDGHMVLDKMMGIVGNHPLVDDIKQAVMKCNQITKEDPVATTVAMHVCYGEEFPVRFQF